MRGNHSNTTPLALASQAAQHQHNCLLSHLPAEDLAILVPKLKLVAVEAGEVLTTPGMTITHAYFPITAIMSMLHTLESGASAEIAVIGNDGLVGSSLLMGAEVASCWTVTESAGMAYRIGAQQLKDAFYRSSSGHCSDAFQHLLLHYTQVLLTQMAQTAVCYRHHRVEQRLCRWLLMRLDRLPGNELLMTQEQIASLLGVRREGITEAACHLQMAGVIDYHRGHISVLDRQGLEACACECYEVVRQESNRLLGVTINSHARAIQLPVA